MRTLILILYSQIGSGIEVSLLCPGPTFSDLLQVAATENPGEKFGETMRSSDKVLVLKNRYYIWRLINLLENDSREVCPAVTCGHRQQDS